MYEMVDLLYGICITLPSYGYYSCASHRHAAESDSGCVQCLCSFQLCVLLELNECFSNLECDVML